MKSILKKYKKQFIGIAILVFTCSILNVIHPYIIKLVLDLDFSSANVVKNILILIFLYAIIHILFAIFKNVRNIIVNKTSAGVLKDLRTELFNKVLSLDVKTFEKYSSADIYTRLTIDVDNMFTLFSDSIPVLVNNILYLILIIIMMFGADLRLALIGIGSLVAISITLILYVNKLKNINDRILDKRDMENREYANFYDTNKLGFLYNLKENNINKMNGIFDLELKLRKKYIFVDTFPFTTTNLLEAIAIFIIIYISITFNLNVDLGSIYLVIYYIKHSRTPFNEIFNRIEEIQTCLNSYKRLKRILEIKQYENLEIGENINIKGEIEFINVSMKYDENLVLKNISFKIESGQKVTIVGKTGVGKTTLTSLLMKLYDSYTGNILIDGKDIRNLSTKSIREQVSYISQKPYIFRDTLRHNIILNKQDIKDEEIMEVINKIGANNLLNKFQNGLDEQIDYKKVSYGEMQIIAFIRAILRNTNIFIFDEPTSNMDFKSEKMVQNLIDNIAKDKTVIIIAHRQSTIESSDKIIYLKDGKIDMIKNK